MLRFCPGADKRNLRTSRAKPMFQQTKGTAQASAETRAANWESRKAESKSKIHAANIDPSIVEVHVIQRQIHACKYNEVGDA